MNRLVDDDTVRDWVIVVEGAPVRCAPCGRPILGSGEGPVRVLLEAAARHLQEEHRPPDRVGDGVAAGRARVILSWNSDFESAFLEEGRLGDAEGTADVYETDVPAELWAAFTVAHGAQLAAHRRIVDYMGFDEESGRLSKPCPAWEGELYPGHSSWSVVLAAGADPDGPQHDVRLAWKPTQRDAVSLVESLPEELYVLADTGRDLVYVRREQLRVEQAVMGPWTSRCHRCGWSHDEHEGWSDTTVTAEQTSPARLVMTPASSSPLTTKSEEEQPPPTVRWRMGYAWPLRPSVRRSMGANHVVLDEPLSIGRLRREAGDALCIPRRRFRNLDVHEGETVRRASGETVSCAACLQSAERLGLDLAQPGPADR